ncbi:MAG: hypothetical protein ABIP95_02130 [Pelobium sp.]
MPLKFAFFLVILIVVFSCNRPPKNLLVDEIKIDLSKDSSEILIKGIDPFIFKQIALDSLSEKDWQNILAVYFKVEEDLQDLQSPIKGVYSIQKNIIRFKPDTTFKKGKEYLVEIYVQKPNTEITENLRRDQQLFDQNYISKAFRF